MISRIQQLQEALSLIQNAQSLFNDLEPQAQLMIGDIKSELEAIYPQIEYEFKSYKKNLQEALDFLSVIDEFKLLKDLSSHFKDVTEMAAEYESSLKNEKSELYI